MKVVHFMSVISVSVCSIAIKSQWYPLKSQAQDLQLQPTARFLINVISLPSFLPPFLDVPILS